MYIEINPEKGKHVVSEIMDGSREIDRAAKILNEVHSSLGSCSGSAVPELRKKIKSRENALKTRKVSVQSLAEVLEKVISKYNKTEDAVLAYEAGGLKTGKVLDNVTLCVW